MYKQSKTVYFTTAVQMTVDGVQTSGTNTFSADVEGPITQDVLNSLSQQLMQLDETYTKVIITGWQRFEEK